MKRVTKDPVLLVFCGLIVLSVPTIFELAHHYPSLDQRMRQASGWMAPAPASEQLLAQVQQIEPATVGMELRLTYAPDREPRTGLCAVYELRKGEAVVYRLILFRHDIACGKCRDILAVALYDAQEHTLRRILLIEPWEVEEGIVDTDAFLTQFLGRKIWERFEIGGNVDGLSGATNSAEGLVERLNEMTGWLAEHSMELDTSVQLSERQGL